MRLNLIATVATAVLISASAVLPSPTFAQEASTTATAPTKNILVFGDSLTWGWVPSSPITPSTRHKMEDRWTTVMAEALGTDYNVVVEGLSGRTTNIDDPSDPKLNGAAYLPAALASHEPLDLVIIMLGTNDTKAYLKRTPLEIALGAGALINEVHKTPGWDWTDYPTPQVLLINPPPLGATIDPNAVEAFDTGSQQKSGVLGKLYADTAALAGEHSFDSSTVITTDGIDGVHFSAETNRALGTAVAEEVRRILGD